MDMASEPAVAGRLMDRLLERKVAWYEGALAEIGDVLDVACEGDDLGGQTSTLISPEMFRRLVKPQAARPVRDDPRALDGEGLLPHLWRGAGDHP